MNPSAGAPAVLSSVRKLSDGAAETTQPDWVAAEAYRAARPDPLAEAAAGIMEHMNRDHADALVTFARVLARAKADEAAMVAVDRLGFKLRIRSGDELHAARIPFPREVTTAEAARVVLIEMLREARTRGA